ncbi:hypothetical protein [Klebsiella variicola]|uniref:Uncharacterized protein n=1 Tax=Klebsiella variicola TaxID=244366 RepID=A0A7H0EV80_KLEVA|nr:hypothetical protein [Klebsiella variicola]QNP27696.1 hypothetical protein IAP99_27150 [Klebsiella variicola]
MDAKKIRPVGVGIVIPQVLESRETLFVYDPHGEIEWKVEPKYMDKIKSSIDAFNTTNEKPRCLDFD